MTGSTPATRPTSHHETIAQIEDRICSCGAGHGSGEAHMGWCDFVSYQALPDYPATDAPLVTAEQAAIICHEWFHANDPDTDCIPDLCASIIALHEALAAANAERDHLLKDKGAWVEAARKWKFRYDAAEARADAAEARVASGQALSSVICECGMSGPCMWGECKHPFRAALETGAGDE